MMKCQNCNKDYCDIIKHLRKNKDCKKAYNFDELAAERKSIRLQKQRDSMKKLYEQKKEKICLQKKEYYKKNKEKILNQNRENYKQKRERILKQNKDYYGKNKIDICLKKAVSFQKTRPLVCQRKRFQKYLTEKATCAYLSEQQQHLYHHTKGFCQPETMTFLNHSVEYYEGLCHSCGKSTSIKIIGVNRLVCLSCKKAHCHLCKAEVSPNPEEGCFHFWPPGTSLDFIPGFCPLYSIYPADYAERNCITNKRNCRMCDDILKRYPEYELFSETVNTSELYRRCYFKQMDVLFYRCNLCNTRVNFVCEFDHHMRSHTKYGHKVAIVGFIARIEEAIKRDHVKEEHFVKLEKEFMKLEGVASVLTVLWKEKLKQYFDQGCLEDITLGAALLIHPGVNLQTQISKQCLDRNLIRRLKVLVVRPHFIPDNDGLGAYDYKRQKFHDMLCWQEPTIHMCFEPKPRMYDRNMALLTSRCSLSYPDDR